jgi:hypothetical protein
MKKEHKHSIIFTIFLIITLGSVYFFSSSSPANKFSKYIIHSKGSSLEQQSILESNTRTERAIASKQENLIQMTKLHSKIQREAKAINQSNLKYKMRGTFAAINSHQKSQSSIIISSNESNYSLLENLYAIKKSEVKDTEDLNIKEEKLGYYIVSSDLSIPEDAIRVVQNQETNTYAIFTGVLKVKLNDMAVVDSVLSDFSYDIQNTYEDINLVMYKFYTFDETMDAYNSLKNNSKVNRVTIDLLEYERSHR